MGFTQCVVTGLGDDDEVAQSYGGKTFWPNDVRKRCESKR